MGKVVFNYWARTMALAAAWSMSTLSFGNVSGENPSSEDFIFAVVPTAFAYTEHQPVLSIYSGYARLFVLDSPS